MVLSIKKTLDRIRNPNRSTTSVTVYLTNLFSLFVQGLSMLAYTWVMVMLVWMRAGSTNSWDYYCTLLFCATLLAYLVSTFMNSVRDFNEARQQDRYFRERL